MLYAAFLASTLMVAEPTVIDHEMPVRVAWVEAICAGRRPSCTIVETRDRVCFSRSTEGEQELIHCYPKIKDYS